jgi:hypothetical protein
LLLQRKWHSGLFRGLDGAFSFSARERKRLLAPDWLAGRSDRGDLSHMKGMRSCEKDCLHAGVSDRFFEPGRYFERFGGREIADQVGLLTDAADEPQALAFALYRLDDVFSPPAEADDRCIDHERVVEIA